MHFYFLISCSFIGVKAEALVTNISRCVQINLKYLPYLQCKEHYVYILVNWLFKGVLELQSAHVWTISLCETHRWNSTAGQAWWGYLIGPISAWLEVEQTDIMKWSDTLIQPEIPVSFELNAWKTLFYGVTFSSCRAMKPTLYFIISLG